MGTYNVHGGHNSIVQGANFGGRKEHVMDRQVKDALISKLRSLGHTVYDCTDETGSTQSANLRNIVAKCNAHRVDLDISLHLNAFNGSANGVEVCYYDQQALAAKVSKQLADDIGWSNRGAKPRTDLYVLNTTSAPAILIELGFIDNEGDMAKWNVDKIADSICYAITGQRTGSTGGGSTSGSTGGSTGGGTTTPPQGGYDSSWFTLQNGVFTLNRSINLRTAPFSSAPLIATLNAGDTVKYEAYGYEKDGFVWLRQNRGNGNYGYIASGETSNGQRISYWGTFQ
ncbi:N-acetylmuramoyl-L-alanine amidase [Bacillus phage vB_BanH_Emiliahah]|nr:N-acetylmuramoyl-L-alanine amidase [Bacillus phage vB_BanH_Emiliahah]